MFDIDEEEAKENEQLSITSIKHRITFESEPSEQPSMQVNDTIRYIHSEFQRRLGNEGRLAYEVANAKPQHRMQGYSVSLISAISQ